MDDGPLSVLSASSFSASPGDFPVFPAWAHGARKPVSEIDGFEPAKLHHSHWIAKSHHRNAGQSTESSDFTPHQQDRLLYFVERTPAGYNVL
jgi:hypothetical protein